jgi:hypothetical protein
VIWSSKADIKLGDHKLTGLAEPNDEDDAATKIMLIMLMPQMLI